METHIILNCPRVVQFSKLTKLMRSGSRSGQTWNSSSMSHAIHHDAWPPCCATETALKLNIHVSAVNNWIDSFKKGHQCSKCAKNFGSRQRLTDHERTYHSEQSVRALGEGFSGRFTSEWKQEVVDFAAQNGRDKTCEVYALSESTLRGFIKMMHNPMYCHICSGKEM